MENNKQAELIGKMVESNQKMGLYDGDYVMDNWQEIFAEIEGSLHSEMPIRVKNWLKNKFHSPIKK
jgi:hypothetical protein